jgi:putative sterol carrier protein
MRALVGPDVFTHPRKVGRLVWPNSMSTTPGIYVHQDFVVEGVPDMFTSWVPLVDCPAELGGLAILTGSQNHGIVARLGQVDPADDAWAGTDYRVGDVLVFHCLTAHGALPNRTTALRLSVDYRWQSAGTPLPADALKPHLLGSIPDWDELAADWRTRAWITPPPELTIVERTGGESCTVPPSGFVTVPVQSPHEGEHTVLAGMFNNLRDAFRPAKAAGRQAVVDYHIASDSGDTHRWQITVSGGECEVHSQGRRTPQVTINSDFRDYLRIVSGKLDPMVALSTGKLRIEGEMTLAAEQLQWFRD